MEQFACQQPPKNKQICVEPENEETRAKETTVDTVAASECQSQVERCDNETAEPGEIFHH